MNVTVYGFGSMGRRHVMHARRLGHAVRVHDPACGLGEPGEAGEALALSDAEACVIAAPAAAHARLLDMAMERGLPVLVEKPLAVNATQARYVLQRHGADARTMVGYNLRFHPHTMEMKAYLQRGAAGPLVGADFHVLTNGDTWPGRSYADALLECSHEIDLATWLLGPASVATAESRKDGREWVLWLAHESGISSRVHLSTAHTGGYQRGAVVLTTRGELCWTWDAPEGLSLLSNHYTRDRLVVHADDTYLAELRWFLGGVGSSDPNLAGMAASLQDGLRVLELCDAARASAAGV